MANTPTHAGSLDTAHPLTLFLSSLCLSSPFPFQTTPSCTNSTIFCIATFCSVLDAPDGNDYQNAFTLNASLKSSKTYTIVCPDEGQKNKWVKCLVTTIRANDLGEHGRLVKVRCCLCVAACVLLFMCCCLCVAVCVALCVLLFVCCCCLCVAVCVLLFMCWFSLLVNLFRASTCHVLLTFSLSSNHYFP
jgi:hypothetical protein